MRERNCARFSRGKRVMLPKEGGEPGSTGEKKLHCSRIRQVLVLIYTAGTRSELYNHTSSKISM